MKRALFSVLLLALTACGGASTAGSPGSLDSTLPVHYALNATLSCLKHEGLKAWRTDQSINVRVLKGQNPYTMSGGWIVVDFEDAPRLFIGFGTNREAEEMWSKRMSDTWVYGSDEWGPEFPGNSRNNAVWFAASGKELPHAYAIEGCLTAG
jgi:hypothetical protein